MNTVFLYSWAFSHPGMVETRRSIHSTLAMKPEGYPNAWTSWPLFSLVHFYNYASRSRSKSGETVTCYTTPILQSMQRCPNPRGYEREVLITYRIVRSRSSLGDWPPSFVCSLSALFLRFVSSEVSLDLTSFFCWATIDFLIVPHQFDLSLSDSSWSSGGSRNFESIPRLVLTFQKKHQFF